MNIIFFINLILGLLYLKHIDISDISIVDTVVVAIIIFNLFLINKFKKSETRAKDLVKTRPFFFSFKSRISSSKGTKTRKCRINKC